MSEEFISSVCGKTLLDLVARGSAILAEMQRLSHHIPKVAPLSCRCSAAPASATPRSSTTTNTSTTPTSTKTKSRKTMTWWS